jgi:ParB family chromosome partitioning protein
MVSDAGRCLLQAGAVPLARIDPKDERFRITTGREPDGLCDSIARLGLLIPPLVRPESGGWTAVSGFRRIDACRRLGWDSLPVRMLQADCSLYACARHAVGENSTQRPLNPIETSLALRLLERHAPDGRIPAEDLAAMGLPANARMVARLKTLTVLPPAVQAGILEGSIALAAAWELGELEHSEASMLAELLRPLRTSLNKQRELIALFKEIALREAVPLANLLNDPQLVAADGGAEEDRNQQVQRLRSTLRRRRFPTIAAAEDGFRILQARLTLGENIRLAPPRDFEGTHFSLSLDFNQPEDIERLQNKLDELRHHPDLLKILTLKCL